MRLTNKICCFFMTVILFVYCLCSCLFTSVTVGDDSPAAADDVAKVDFCRTVD